MLTTWNQIAINLDSQSLGIELKRAEEVSNRSFRSIVALTVKKNLWHGISQIGA
jgi:hypothetical protein